MITYYGEPVWPDRRGGAPSLASIGVGLGRMPRFAGQTREWYPVLAHVLVCAELVEPEARVHALLHDAAEAIVGDVPTTWKTRAAKAREEVILRRVYAELRLEWPVPIPEAYEVARADRMALNAEATVLGHASPGHFGIPSDHAMILTRRELAKCRAYLEPRAASAIYADAVNRALLVPA